MSMKWIRYQRK